ncbi:28341_t:CDS:2, partial [Dentiscutata erythropus]
LGSEGMVMCVTNGTQNWDTGLTVLAVIETGLADDPLNYQSMIHALEFLDDTQIKKNPKDSKRCYRDNTLGTWGFSTREHGYNVSDCSSLGLEAVLNLQNKLSYTPKLVSKERLCQIIDILLTMQNSDGGQITKRAIQYLYNSQDENGGWYGSWAICFTYATMFVIQCLKNYEETYENSLVVKKGCDFLISKQKEDGGWGESYKSCDTETYIHHENLQVVNTAFALLALMAGQDPARAAYIQNYANKQIMGAMAGLVYNLEVITNQITAAELHNTNLDRTGAANYDFKDGATMWQELTI